MAVLVASFHTLCDAQRLCGARAASNMHPADSFAATVDDDAEVLRAIRVAANGALDDYWYENGRPGTSLPLQWEGVSLVSVDATGLAIATLSAEVGRLTGLRSLDLRDCTELATLPPELSGCVALEILNIQGGPSASSGFAFDSLPRQCAVMLHACTGIAATANVPRLSAEQTAVLRALREGSGGLLDEFWPTPDDNGNDDPRWGGLADTAHHVVLRIVNPHFFSKMASYDVAINISLALTQARGRGMELARRWTGKSAHSTFRNVQRSRPQP